MAVLMVTHTATTMTLSPQQALYKLQTWFSPSYPVGAYTYSHGLENAFETMLVTTVDQSIIWIGDILDHGSGFSDAVFLANSHFAASLKCALRYLPLLGNGMFFCTLTGLPLLM